MCEQLHEDAQLFPALFGLRSYYQFSDQLQRAHDTSQQLLQLAGRTGNEDHRLEAYVAMASTHYFLGELQEGNEFAEMGIQLYDPVRHRNHATSYGLDPGVFCRSRYAQVSWLLGFPDRAVMEIGNALSLAESIEHPYSLIFAVHNATMIHLFRLDAKAALASAHQGYRLANQYNFTFLFCWASYLLAWAHALAGDSESANKQLAHALAVKVPESRTTQDFIQVYLAETYYHLGMPLPGLQALDDAALSGQEFFLHRRTLSASRRISADARQTPTSRNLFRCRGGAECPDEGGGISFARRPLTGQAMARGRQDIGGAQIAHGKLPIDHCCRARPRFEIGSSAFG